MPSTLVASAEYWRSRLLDWQIVWWSFAIGTPAIVAGSFLTPFVSAPSLCSPSRDYWCSASESPFCSPKDRSLAREAAKNPERLPPSCWRLRLIAVAIGVGLISGLLANAGGFLLVPCYTEFLKQPMKKAFACSLAVSAALAVPGTIVHAYLGHISWLVTCLVALGSIPFSLLGARLAIKTRSAKLERWYGLTLTCLGIFFLMHL